MLYVRESWTIKARDTRTITETEMKYTRITGGYTGTDYKTNRKIAKELKIIQERLKKKTPWP